MPSSALCTRCGDQLVDGPAKVILDRPFCAACLEVEGVDFLDEYRRQFWGKRDGYIWLLGGLGLVHASIFLLGVIGLAASQGDLAGLMVLLAFAPVLLARCAFSIATLALWKPIRFAWLFFPPVATAWSLLVLGSTVGLDPRQTPQIIVGAVIGFVFVLAAWRSDRNKLAYKIDVPEEKLYKLYQTYVDNSWARSGIALGVISLIPFFGVLGLIGLPVSIVGLRKVDEDAWPPVGLRKRAIWGIVLSCIGMLISAALFTSILLKE